MLLRHLGDRATLRVRYVYLLGQLWWRMHATSDLKCSWSKRSVNCAPPLFCSETKLPARLTTDAASRVVSVFHRWFRFRKMVENGKDDENVVGWNRPREKAVRSNLCLHDFGVSAVARARIFGSVQSNNGRRHGSRRDLARGLVCALLALFSGRPKATVLSGF